jgi:hypothetical protein
MKLQPHAGEKIPAALARFREAFLVVGENHEVIHVAKIRRRAQHFLDKMIEPVQVHIGEKLARLISQRQPAPAFRQRPQIIPREERQRRLLRVAVVNDPLDQPQRVGVLDFSAQQCLENLVVDGRWKENTWRYQP